MGAVLLACQSSADEGAAGSDQTVVTIEPIVGSLPAGSAVPPSASAPAAAGAPAAPAATPTPTTVAPTTTVAGTDDDPTAGADLRIRRRASLGVGGRRPADVPGQPQPHVSRRRSRPRAAFGALALPRLRDVRTVERVRRHADVVRYGVGRPAGGVRAGRPDVGGLRRLRLPVPLPRRRHGHADPAAVPDRRHRQGHGDGRPGRVPVGVRRIAGQQAARAGDRSSGSGRAVGARLDGSGVAAAAVEQRLGRRTADRGRLPRDGR